MAVWWRCRATSATRAEGARRPPPHGRPAGAQWRVSFSGMARSPLDRLRALCLALPESHEVEAWGAPTFRVRTKLFAMYAAPSTHHGAGRAAVWCKAQALAQDMLIRSFPTRYFKPPYVGPSGWVGAWIDGNDVDWDALSELLTDGWRMTAPKRVVGRHDAGEAAPSGTAPSDAAETRRSSARKAQRSDTPGSNTAKRAATGPAHTKKSRSTAKKRVASTERKTSTKRTPSTGRKASNGRRAATERKASTKRKTSTGRKTLTGRTASTTRTAATRRSAGPPMRKRS